MPIAASDIQLRLSGGAGNTDPTASLGGPISSTAAGGNVFDAVSSAEASGGRTEYRCVYVRNNDGTRTLSNVRMWFTTASSGGRASHAIGVGTSGVNGTEQITVSETTAPSGVSFSTPTAQNVGAVLGNIPAGQHQAVWFRRTVPPGAAAGADGFAITVTGDSPP